MKKLGIVSDTHGYLACLDKIVSITANQNIDMWFHAGDYGDDAQYLAKLVTVPVYAVRGNNDYITPLEPQEQLVPVEDTYVYMVHGHRISAYHRVQELITLGRGMGAKLSIAGHSHHHGSYDAGDCLYVNPGSPALPRDGSGGTFAVAVYDGGKFSVDFFYLRDFR